MQYWDGYYDIRWFQALNVIYSNTMGIYVFLKPLRGNMFNIVMFHIHVCHALSFRRTLCPCERYRICARRVIEGRVWINIAYTLYEYSWPIA